MDRALVLSAHICCLPYSCFIIPAPAEPPTSSALYGSAWPGQFPMITQWMIGFGVTVEPALPLYWECLAVPVAHDHPRLARDALGVTRLDVHAIAATYIVLSP